MPINPTFVGPSYNLNSRPASVQRTVNMIPVPLEPGNERTSWTLKDVPGLVAVVAPVAATIAWFGPDPFLIPGSQAGVPTGGTAPDINESGTVTSDGEPANFFAGFVGGDPGGTIVWTRLWVPTISDAAPFLGTYTANNSLSIFVRGENSEVSTKGILTITATRNGVPAAGTLTLAITAGSPYENCAWNRT